MSKPSVWGSAITPATSTILIGETAAGVAGRFTVGDAFDATAICGTMYDTTGSNTISATTSYSGVVTFTSAELDGVTFVNNATADYLVVPVGKYYIAINISYGINGAATVHWALHVNGVACTRCLVTETAGSAVTDLSAANSTIRTLSANSQLSLRAKTSTARTITIYTCSLTAFRIGA